MSQASETANPQHIIDLVKLARQGDVNAFNELVLCFQDQVYQLTYWILKDPYLAEDITQNTFINAYQKLEQFRGGSFRAWLTRIATNACFDELRRNKRRKILSITPDELANGDDEKIGWLTDPGISVEQHVEENEFTRYIQDCIHEIPEKYRTPILLIDMFDMNYQESANILKINLGTLKSRLSRGRIILKERLSKSSPYHQLIDTYRQPYKGQQEPASV